VRRSLSALYDVRIRWLAARRAVQPFADSLCIRVPSEQAYRPIRATPNVSHETYRPGRSLMLTSSNVKVPCAPSNKIREFSNTCAPTSKHLAIGYWWDFDESHCPRPPAIHTMPNNELGLQAVIPSPAILAYRYLLLWLPLVDSWPRVDSIHRPTRNSNRCLSKDNKE